MPVKLEEYGGVCVISTSGDFTSTDASDARQAAVECIENRQIADVVVDLEKTVFIDSDGLEALLWMKRRCEDLFGHFKLAAVSENVKKILEITRLGRRFETAADVPTALKTMR